eukprot:1157768-Pelagomonas_calceolata.AAC.6
MATAFTGVMLYLSSKSAFRPEKKAGVDRFLILVSACYEVMRGELPLPTLFLPSLTNYHLLLPHPNYN